MGSSSRPNDRFCFRKANPCKEDYETYHPWVTHHFGILCRTEAFSNPRKVRKNYNPAPQLILDLPSESALPIEIPCCSSHIGQVSFETSDSFIQEDLLSDCCSVVLPLAMVSPAIHHHTMF